MKTAVSEYVAILSGNTDLLEKAKLDKKITALESERKNFMKERDSASGKLCELQHSVDFHSSHVTEAQNDLAQFGKRVQRDGDGNPINKLEINGVKDNSDIKTVAARLQEIAEKARTEGEHHKIGTIYGFDILVKTESSMKDLFQSTINRFFVKGEGSIYYTHNNGKLASDPKLACLNFLSALERIPKVIATHEKELSKASQDINIYKAISTGVWNKEDELRSIKAQAAELDRKIALTLNPPSEEYVAKEGQQTRNTQEQSGQHQSIGNGNTAGSPLDTSNTFKSASSYAQTSTPQKEEKQDIMSKVVFSRPKMR